MKKALLSLTFLVTGAFSLLSQGTVQFDNGSWNFTTDTFDRNVYADRVGGQLLDQANYQVGLFENRGGTWTQLGTLLNFDFGGGATIPGIWSWDGELRTLSVPNGVDTQLQVRLYDAQGTFLSNSDSFTFRNANSTPTGATDPLMMNFRAFAVPEPSTVALGVLGLGALILFRRRK